MSSPLGRGRRAAGLTALLLVVSACGTGDRFTGEGNGPVGEVTVMSDDSQDTTRPLCVEDIPDDYTTCADAPANLGQLQLAPSRKIGINVPRAVAAGGWRVRVNGEEATLPIQQPINDATQPLVIPPEVVALPGETVLTVEALHSYEHPKAVWQFLLADPV